MNNKFRALFQHFRYENAKSGKSPHKSTIYNTRSVGFTYGILWAVAQVIQEPSNLGPLKKMKLKNKDISTDF